MAAILAAMAAPGAAAQPVLVAANRPEAPGLAHAEKHGVPTVCVDHRRWGKDREGFERALSAEIEAAGADLVVLSGFMRLLTPWFVARWRDRLINIHPSLLPLFRGLDTHARALEAGVAVHGCTVHLVRDDVDAGPIIGQGVVPVIAGDTPERLARRVVRMEHRLYPAALQAFAAGDLTVEGERIIGQTVALFDADA
jgi:phosphoribosylglycinamide formyltransferase-1